MAKRTCSVSGCSETLLARGLCSGHYQAARRRGDLPPKPTMPSWFHSLTNVDREARLADCSICGPRVPIRLVHRLRHAECKAKVREMRLARVYGLSADDYNRLVERQGGRCAICKEDGARLFVDHDHATGAVRGLLCHDCNIAISWLDDDPERALSAARYLRPAN